MEYNFDDKDLGRELEARKSASREDVDKVLRNEEKIKKMAKKGHLARFFKDIVLFFQLLEDYTRGRYKRVPLKTIAAIVGALVYVLCPIDLIPDFLPGIGYVDDAGVMALCLKLVQADINRYRDWKEDGNNEKAA